MKLETFFEKFDQFADAPDAVEKMRGLVKELAIQGRLTPQNSPEENATDVLTAISREKRDRAEDLRLPATESVGSDVSAQFRIPANWLWVNMANVALQIQYGYTASADPTATETRMLRITDIQNGNVDWPSVPGCQIESSEAERYRLHPNDILIARTGGTIGKSFIVQDAPAKSVFASYLIRITPPRSMVARYLKIFLESPLYWTQLREMSAGTGQPNVNGKALGRLELPLPPLAEQERIVARVDELMALCDRLEAQKKERETRHVELTRAAIARFDEAPTPANLNFLFHPSYSISPADLRRTILSLAVQGKLVFQDLTDEPAQQLLKLISAKYESGARRRALSELSPELLFDLPPGWCWARFPELGEFGRGKSKHRPRNDRSLFVGGKYPLVQTGDVARSNGTVLTFTGLYNDVGLAQSKMWPAGTLCITIAANIADSGVLAIDACFPDSVVGFVPDHLIPSVRFFEYFMRTAKDRLEQYAPSTAQKNINLAILEQVWIPFPPANEQRRIVAKVDQLMEWVDQLESRLATSEKTAKELLDAVVHELLRPTADVIEFPRSDSDRASNRAAIGCYAIEHLVRNPSFGHTMNMKVVYMAQAHIGLPLDLKFERKAAGPWHPWIEEFDALGQSEGWFTVTQKSIGNDRTKYEYAPKPALKQKAAEADAVLGEHKAEFDRLLSLFADMKTVDAEIVATLFAAWNDFLIDGKSPSDDEIIREVRTNWHDSKVRFSPALLKRWLDWMRSHHLTPKGHGPRTTQQLKLALS